MTAAEFSSTYIPLSDALYRVAYYILESREDAEDAVQDLLLKLYKSRSGLDSVHNPKAYSITLMRNLCIDRVRGAEKALRLMEETAEDAVSPDNPQQRMETSERLSRARSVILSLPRGEREVLRLRVLEGLSYEEISRQTGLNPLSLRVLLSRARKKIRKSAI